MEKIPSKFVNYLEMLLSRINWMFGFGVFVMLFDLVFSDYCLAKIINVQATGQYITSNMVNESPEIAKDRARMEAKRLAIEKVGVYVESNSTVKDSKLVRDNINTLSARIVSVKKEEFRVKNSKDGKVYICDIEVELDDTVDILKLAKNKRLLDEYRIILERYDDIAKENVMLRSRYLAADENEKIRLKALIAENEKNVTVLDWIEKAAYASQQHKYIDAMLYISKAIEVNQNDAYCYECRAGIYLKLKQYNEALADYNKAIEIERNSIAAYNGRGVVYYNLMEFDKALNDFDKVMSMDKNYPLVYINIGSVYLGQEKYHEAIKEISKAISIIKDRDENYALAYHSRGLAYYKLEQYELAVQDFTMSIETQPSMNSYKMRGMSFVSLGKYDECYPDFDKAASMGLEKDVTDAVVYMMFGERLKKCGEYEKAISEYTKSIAIYPALSASFYGRMQCYGNLKKYDEALKDLDRYLEIEPNNEEAKQLRQNLLIVIDNSVK